MSYTNNISSDDEAKFSLAVELRDHGKFDEALVIIDQLLHKYPQKTAVLVTAAYLHWELRELDEAIKLFKLATEMSPKSEEISLGFFHCLWEIGRQVEALDEAKRFISVSDSKDYVNIIKEINQTTAG